MKNRLILFAIACISMFVFSCKGKDDAAFTISGALKNHDSLKTVELLRLDSMEFAVADTATLGADGKFEFKQSLPYANLFRIRAGQNQYDVIARNGDVIEITATAGSADYDVKGSPDAVLLKEFNKLSSFYGEKNSKLSAEYEEKSKITGQSDSLINIYRPIFQKNIAEYNGKLLEFADKNKSSLVSFYAMISVDPREYEKQLITYADDIKDKFTENPTVQRFVKQMMLIKPVSVGQKAQDFTIQGLDGKSISLADYKGKYVMLDFWASWCAPCRRENPNVVKQYNIYKSKGLNILGISLDTEKGKWEQAIAADGLTWAHASELQSFEGPVERLYQIQAIPSNFIIDPQGIIIAKNITGSALEEFLKITFSRTQ
ncbi:MAG: AhpC/TSA family protein [Sphingobacteriaceae bacterium]|nr:MAG: AhpC/TSA family protein [Sphingobacteriaceae bacterium]